MSVLILLVAIASAAAEIPAAEWTRAVRGVRSSYDQSDEAAFRRHLQTIARDNSPRAVDAIFKALTLASELDFYDQAVMLLSRMTQDKARAKLLRLARRASKWRQRYASIEAVSRWSTGETLVLGALSARQAPIRRLAMRLVGDLELTQGIEKMIEMLVALDRGGSRSSVEARDLRESLLQLTRKKLETGQAYQAWWKGLDFVSKSELLSRKTETQQQTRKEGEGGSVSPVMDWMKRRRRKDWRYITTRRKSDILVVPGVFDKVQQVLTHMKIQHTVVARNQIGKQKLDPSQILIFNCTRTPGILGQPQVKLPPGLKLPKGFQLQGLGGNSIKLSKATIKKIRTFVRQGGYLFTSDWELVNVLTRAFPEYVGVAGYTAQHNYAIRPVKNNWNHPLLRGVFSDGPYRAKKLRWKIDQASFLIKIRSSRVTSLVYSDPLKKRYNNGLVAITFSPLARGSQGNGRVLHVLSHFEKQYTGAEDGYALQKMLLNFIALKQSWRKKPKKR